MTADAPAGTLLCGSLIQTSATESRRPSTPDGCLDFSRSRLASTLKRFYRRPAPGGVALVASLARARLPSNTSGKVPDKVQGYLAAAERPIS
jgi:hypothetical protein